ncbi:hypothetical protein HDU76_008957 [Blyttiomyces sp. JEL0837]|nr:hypothetical protein HDU76_008957 [Blyttiomyces sp. JEL0837]
MNSTSDTKHDTVPTIPTIPTTAKSVYSFRWQDGYVSPFLASDNDCISAIIRSLVKIYSTASSAPNLSTAENSSSSSSQPTQNQFNGILDLGSGKGDVILTIAKESISYTGKLYGIGNPPYIGVELDSDLVNESKSRLLEMKLDQNYQDQVVLVNGDIVTRELFDYNGVGNLDDLVDKVDVITLFLLPVAIGKILSWLRERLEEGKTVISVKWPLSYSGNNLEDYRDDDMSDHHDVKVYRKRNGILEMKEAQRTAEIAKLRANVQAMQALKLESKRTGNDMVVNQHQSDVLEEVVGGDEFEVGGLLD